MAHAFQALRSGAAEHEVLGLGEQISRDARTRLIAAAAVILVHAAYPPGHPALAALPPGAQRVTALAFALVVTFPVNTFVLLSFMNLAPRLRAGVPGRQLLRVLLRRLAPAHLFWTAAFLSVRAAATRQLPSPRGVVEAFALGSAAAHLYFIPLLVALTAAAPLLERLARTPARAACGGVALALAAVGLHLAVDRTNPWLRALAGFTGFAPFAVAGLALARAWGGVAPGGARSQRIVAVAGAAAAVSVVALGVAATAARRDPSIVASAWAGGNAYALAVPVLLLTVRGAASPRVIRLAQYSLGVYLVHPMFIQALRVAEGRVRLLAGSEPLLVVPNAVVTAVMSVAAVALLARSPLRRVVL